MHFLIFPIHTSFLDTNLKKKCQNNKSSDNLESLDTFVCTKTLQIEMLINIVNDELQIKIPLQKDLDHDLDNISALFLQQVNSQ